MPFLTDPSAFHVDIARARSFTDLCQVLPPLLERYKHLLPADPRAKILLKPNLNANMNALTGNTTDLRLLSAVIRVLQDRGYTDITIGEGTNSGFYRNKIGVISRLMVDKLAAYHGVAVTDLNYAEPSPVPFADGVTAHVARECVEAELFINLPVLKTHFEAGMTVCLKNMMGCLIGQENKKKTHQSLAANILNLNRAVSPHLHVVDALVAMEGLGPTRGTPVRLDTILVGEDPLLLDLTCARLAKFDHRQVTTLRLAEAQGLLTPAHHAYVKSLDLQGLERPFAPPKAGFLATFIHSPKRQKYFLAVRNTRLFTWLASTQWFGNLLFCTGLRQDVFLKDEMRLDGLDLDRSRCDDCGVCRDFCPVGSDPRVVLEKKGQAWETDCIKCLYCYMICPKQAIVFRGEMGFLGEQMRQYEEIVRGMGGKA